MDTQPSRPFIKMHGLGNDFVVVDARTVPFTLDADQARRIADRRTGVGCDQIVVMEPPTPDGGADLFMRIRNADGGEVAACGNATRCVAALVMAETGRRSVTVETLAGLLPARFVTPERVAVDMGRPGLDWRAIPLAHEADTLALPLEAGALSAPVAVSMGNPHAVFFVTDAEAVDLAALGPELEHNPLFPERANISVAHLRGRSHIRLRVWERGAGITPACGTAACAAIVAAARRGLSDRQAMVAVDGGVLRLDWRGDDDHVVMTGPVAESFTGTLGAALLGS